LKHLNANYNATPLGPLFDKPMPQIPDSSDSTTGQQLKEKGIKEVSEHNENWTEHAISTAKGFVAFQNDSTFTGEDIRFACQWMPQPKHPNAWGALISTLIKRKIIVPTGEHRQMKDKSSHARSTPVYKAK